LLAATGLLIESFRHLLAVDPGFRAENVLAARLSLPYDRHPDPAAFHDRLLERLRLLPGVEAAAITQTAPFGRGDHQHEFVVEGREPGPGEPIPVASIRPVSPDYFAAVGTRLLAGRVFTAGDGAAAPPVAVVDQSLARRYWPDGEAVGRRIRHGDVANNPWLTIVGVAAPIKHRGLDGPTAPYIYRPHGQDPRWGVDLVVRTAQPPAAIVPLLRSELRALDPTVPLYDLRSLEDAVGRSVSTRRLTNQLLAGFAAAALVLAALGIYGVVALAVAGRRHEFGIRIALGAVPAAVARLVLYHGLRLALPGVLLACSAPPGSAGSSPPCSSRSRRSSRACSRWSPPSSSPPRSSPAPSPPAAPPAPTRWRRCARSDPRASRSGHRVGPTGVAGLEAVAPEAEVGQVQLIL
jgi:predicted permease